MVQDVFTTLWCNRPPPIVDHPKESETFFSSIGTAGRLGQLNFRFVFSSVGLRIAAFNFQPLFTTLRQIQNVSILPSDRTCKHLFSLFFMQVNVMIFYLFADLHLEETFQSKDIDVLFSRSLEPWRKIRGIDIALIYMFIPGHNALLYEYLKDFIDLHIF